MHPNPAFRQDSRARNLAFAIDRGFGTLSINGDDGPLMAHVPFLMATDGSHADIHLARSNAIARAGLPARAVVAVQGPDAYVSPDWYGMVDQVPTWNYVAVHLRGRLEPLPPEMLRPMVDVLSDRFEQRLLPKKVWRSSKMADGVMERLLRMIVPFRLMIESVDGTWKLNQNKPEQARMGVVTALRALPKDSPEAKIAALMQAEAVLQ
jgi:transcriptional regulator